jgi:hypothetical protein
MLAPARELKTRAANLGHPTNGLVDQTTPATIAVIILSFLSIIARPNAFETPSPPCHLTARRALVNATLTTDNTKLASRSLRCAT